MRKRIRYRVIVLVVLCGTMFALTPSAAHYRHHTGHVNGAVFSPDGSRFATWGTSDKTVRVYDTGASESRVVLPVTTFHVVFSSDSKLVATGSDEHELVVWSAVSGTEQYRLPRFSEHITSFASSQNGTLAVGCTDGTVHLYEFSTGKSSGSIRADTSFIRALALSPDGRQLVSYGPDGLCFWDVATRTRRQVLPEQWHCWQLAFSPDGSVLCSLGTKGCRLWDSATAAERPCALPEGFESGEWASALAFSSDGRTLLGATAEDICLWDVRTGAITQRLPKHHGERFLRFPDRLRLCADSMSYNPLLEAGTITPKGEVMMLGTRRNSAVVWRVASVEIR